MKKLEKLKKDYEKSCNAYIEAFCKKQEIDFDFWIANEVGYIASFALQYSFKMHEIILDIDTNQPKGLILQWQEDSVENPEKTINYQSYTMGLRYKDI